MVIRHIRITLQHTATHSTTLQHSSTHSLSPVIKLCIRHSKKKENCMFLSFCLYERFSCRPIYTQVQRKIARSREHLLVHFFLISILATSCKCFRTLCLSAPPPTSHSPTPHYFCNLAPPSHYRRRAKTRDVTENWRCKRKIVPVLSQSRLCHVWVTSLTFACCQMGPTTQYSKKWSRFVPRIFTTEENGYT